MKSIIIKKILFTFLAYLHVIEAHYRNGKLLFTETITGTCNSISSNDT
jgi:hypothetical protein